MWGDSGVTRKGGSQAGVRTVVWEALREDLGGVVAGSRCCSSALFQRMLGMLI